MLAVLACTFTCVTAAFPKKRDGPRSVAPDVTFPVRLTVVTLERPTFDAAAMFMLLSKLTVGAPRDKLKNVGPKVGLTLRSIGSTTLMLLVALTLTLVKASVLAMFSALRYDPSGAAGPFPMETTAAADAIPAPSPITAAA